MFEELDMNFPSFEDLKQKNKEISPSSWKKVTVLPASISQKKIKVAAYCRVSTHYKDQDTSIYIQREHYENIISSHPEWELVGIYYERVSATHLHTRVQLNRLLEDCRKGKIDLVLTKSISRFARNTTDLLWMVRNLTALGIGIVFEKESIDTRSGDGELMMTLLASYAEEESYSISDNNRWAIQKRFEDGSYKYSSAPYGYDLYNGTLVINKEEAKVVKDIFKSFLNGNGIRKIANELNEKGIPPKRINNNWIKHEHSGIWSPSGISKILKNEFYIGDSILQKHYHDFEFQIRVNKGELPRYYLEDHHEGIISQETFDKANRLLSQRRSEYHSYTRRGKYLFSEKCFCGKCGGTLVRDRNRRTQKQTVYWICIKHRRNAKSCDMKPVMEEDIQNAFITMMNKLHFADMIIDIYSEEIENQWRKAHVDELTVLEEKMIKNKEERDRLTFIKGGAVYFLRKRNKLLNESKKLEADLLSIGKPDTDNIRKLKNYVQNQKKNEFSEDAFSEFIDHVIVKKQNQFTFYFRCGLILTEGKGSCKRKTKGERKK